VVFTCNTSFIGGVSRKITVQGHLSKKYKTLSEKGLKQKKKKARGVAQVVEHFPNKCKALSSNPSIVKKKKKKSRTQWRNCPWIDKGAHPPFWREK
jgi:hypothetical protein